MPRSARTIPDDPMLDRLDDEALQATPSGRPANWLFMVEVPGPTEP
jgi:hypothetical protein